MDNFDELINELKWLERVVMVRTIFPSAELNGFDVNLYLNANEGYKTVLTDKDKEEYNITLPLFGNTGGVYSKITKNYSLEERLLLIMTIANSLKPAFFDILFTQYKLKSIIAKEETYFKAAGLVLKNEFGYVPTIHSFVYMVTGTDIKARLKLLKKVAGDQLAPLESGLISYGESLSHYPKYSDILLISKEEFDELLN